MLLCARPKLGSYRPVAQIRGIKRSELPLPRVWVGLWGLLPVRMRSPALPGHFGTAVAFSCNPCELNING